MTMMNRYNSNGWATTDPSARVALALVDGEMVEVEAPNCGDKPANGKPWGNWSGERWSTPLYVEPAPMEPPLAPVVILPAYVVYRRFTSTERIAIRALSKVDEMAEDFMHSLNGAIASGNPVISSDPETVAGFAYLSTTPVPGQKHPVLAAGRTAEILS